MGADENEENIREIRIKQHCGRPDRQTNRREFMQDRTFHE